MIVPAYNERRLAVLMERLAKSLTPSIRGRSVESNSSDGTREEAQRSARTHACSPPATPGQGTCRPGRPEACTGDRVLFQDADLNTTSTTTTISSRRLSTGGISSSAHVTIRTEGCGKSASSTRRPARRLLQPGHIVFLGLFNFIYRQHLKDPFSMFKVFRRDCLYISFSATGSISTSDRHQTAAQGLSAHRTCGELSGAVAERRERCRSRDPLT